MAETKCPYCKKDLEIDHAGGYGVAENGLWTQKCVCGKKFRYMTEINYITYCQEGDHVMEPGQGMLPGFYRCKNCNNIDNRGE